MFSKEQLQQINDEIAGLRPISPLPVYRSDEADDYAYTPEATAPEVTLPENWGENQDTSGSLYDSDAYINGPDKIEPNYAVLDVIKTTDKAFGRVETMLAANQTAEMNDEMEAAGKRVDAWKLYTSSRPELLREVKAISNETGIPENVILYSDKTLNKARSIYNYRRKQMALMPGGLNEVPLDELAKAYPGLSNILHNGSTIDAVIALENMENIRQMQGIFDAGHTGLKKGQLQRRMDEIGIDPLSELRDPTEEERKKLEDLQKEYMEMREAPDFFDDPLVSLVGRTAEQAPQQAWGLAKGTGYGVAAAATAVVPTVLLAPVTGMTSLALAPQAARTGFSWGMRFGYMKDMFEHSAGRRYMEYTQFKNEKGEKLLTNEEAAAYAVVAAGIETGIEFANADLILKVLKGNKSIAAAQIRNILSGAKDTASMIAGFKKLMSGVGQVTISESVEEGVQTGADMALSNIANAIWGGNIPKYNAGEIIKKSFEDFAEAVIPSLGFGVTAAGSGSFGVVNRMARLAEIREKGFTERLKNIGGIGMIRQMSENAGIVDFFKKDGDVARQVLHDTVKGTGYEKVHIDTEMVTEQEGGTEALQNLAKKAGISEEAVQAALETKTDLTVPTEIYFQEKMDVEEGRFSIGDEYISFSETDHSYARNQKLAEYWEREAKTLLNEDAIRREEQRQKTIDNILTKDFKEGKERDAAAEILMVRPDNVKEGWKDLRDTQQKMLDDILDPIVKDIQEFAEAGAESYRTPDGKVIYYSNNAEWYRQFLKDYNRRPTKEEYRQFAIDALTGKDTSKHPSLQHGLISEEQFAENAAVIENLQGNLAAIDAIKERMEKINLLELETADGMSREAYDIYRNVTEMLMQNAPNQEVKRSARAGAAILARHADRYAEARRKAGAENYTAADYFRDRLGIRIGGTFDGGGDVTTLFQVSPAELNRQKEEVRKQYKGTDQWMKAPNGKHTNLTEDQWVTVRTPAFKNWFGDWENAALIKIARKAWESDKNEDTFAFSPSSKLSKALKNIYGHDINTIKITDGSIRHVRNNHGDTEIESQRGQVALTPDDIVTIPYIVNNFDTIDRSPKHDDKKGNRAIEITKRINGVAVVATIEKGNDKSFLVSSWKIKKAGAADAQNSASQPNVQDDPAINIIKQDIKKLKSSIENSSKIVDENGEPLVVYHGSDADFDVFDITKARSNMDIQGSFFSPWELDAQGYGRNVRAFYLNIRNPANESQGYKALNKYKGQNGAGIKAREDLTAQGFDGVNNENEEYIAFEPNQIKDASGRNVGFNPEAGNIYFQNAGVNARTKNNDKLFKAMDMFAEDKSAEEIYKETGWFRGEDGQWRFEIPDDLEAFDLNKIKIPEYKYIDESVLLSDVYNIPELYEAYPWLKETEIIIANPERVVSPNGQSVLKGAWGFADYENNRIVVNADEYKRTLNKETETKANFIHEIQHLIQRHEGFARGGGPSSVQKQIENQIRLLTVRIKDIHPDAMAYYNFATAFETAFFSGNEDDLKQADKDLTSFKDNTSMTEEQMQQAMLVGSQIATLKHRVEKNENNPYLLYRNLAGEQEANATADRAGKLQAAKQFEKREATALERLNNEIAKLTKEQKENYDLYVSWVEETDEAKFPSYEETVELEKKLPKELLDAYSDYTITQWDKTDGRKTYQEELETMPQPHDPFTAIVTFAGASVPMKTADLPNVQALQGLRMMEKVIETQADVERAMYREELGYIDFRWGTPGNPDKNYKKGYGISHIIAHRNAQGLDGVAIAKKMPAAIAFGEIVDRKETKVTIDYQGVRVFLVNNMNGVKTRYWVLSGYIAIDENKKEENVSARGEGFDSSVATAYTPTPTRRTGDTDSSVINSIAQNDNNDNETDQVFQTRADQEQRKGSKIQGATQIDATGRQLITLFNIADESTMAHELGHVFLNDLKELAAMEKAPEQVKKDWETIKQWLGWKPDQDTLTKEQQEKFARGFEAYLMHGEAPATGLRSIFRRFKTWLCNLYKDFLQLGGVPSLDVQQVMGRMIATEEEVETAFKLREAEAFEKAGGFDYLAPDSESMYKRWRDKAHEYAKEKTLAKAMKDLKQKREEKLEARRKMLTEAIQAQLAEEPVYKAEALLQNSPSIAGNWPAEALGITYEEYKKEIKERGTFDKAVKREVKARMKEYQESMPMEKIREDAEKAVDSSEYRGMCLAFEAQFLRRKSYRDESLNKQIDSMLDEIEKAAGEVGRENNEQADGAEQLQKAVQKLKESTRWQAAELKAINKIARSKTKFEMRKALNEFRKIRRETSQAVRVYRDSVLKESAWLKSYAAETMAQMPITEAKNVSKWRALERTAGIESENWMKKAVDAQLRYSTESDVNPAELWDKATEAKRRQRIFAEYAALAQKNKDSIQVRNAKLQARANTIQKNNNLPVNERYMFNHGLYVLGLAAKDAQKPSDGMSILSMFQYYAGDMTAYFVDEYGNVSLPDYVIAAMAGDGVYKEGYQSLTMEQYDYFFDMLQTIYKAGLDANKIRATTDPNGGAVDLYVVRDAIVAETEARVPVIQNADVTNAGSPTLRQAVERSARQARVELTKIETVLEWMGPAAQRYIYEPVNRAWDREQRMMEEAVKYMEAVWEVYSDEEKTEMRSKKQFRFGTSLLTREEMICIALNWGTELNRKRVLDGYGVDEKTVKNLLSNMTQKDWQTVDSIWDLLETYWPETAKVEEEMAGIAPEKQTAMPFEIIGADGSVYKLKGGYYPIKYDPAKSSKAADDQRNDAAKQLMAGNAAMARNRGFTKMRVETVKGRPMLLSFGVINKHLDDVIHNICFRVALRDVNRILNDPDVQRSIEGHFGQEQYRAMRQWVQDCWAPDPAQKNMFEKTMEFFRHNQTAAALGYRVVIAALNTLNYFPMIHYLGRSRANLAIRRFYSDWRAGADFALSRSVFLRNRAETMDRDTGEILRKKFIGGHGTVIDTAIRAQNAMNAKAFTIMAWTDMALAIPLWTAEYERVRQEMTASAGPNASKGTWDRIEMEAVSAGDKAVRKVFGSGEMKDLAPVQKSSEVMKAATMFYSYFNVVFNALYEGYGEGRRQAMNEGGTRMPGFIPFLGGKDIGIRIMPLVDKFLYWIVLTGVFEGLERCLMDMMTGNDDDDKPVYKYMARGVAETGIGTIPILRDLGAWLLDKVSGEHYFGTRSLPLYDAIDQGNKLWDTVASGRKTKIDVFREGARLVNRFSGASNAVTDAMATTAYWADTDFDTPFYQYLAAILLDKRIDRKKK